MRRYRDISRKLMPFRRCLMFRKSTSNLFIVALSLFLFSSVFSVQAQAKINLPVNRVAVDARLMDPTYSTNYIIVPEEAMKKSPHLELLTKYTKNALDYLKMEEAKKGKLKVFINFQIIRSKKMEVTYTIRAFEAEKEKWRVSASCSARHNADANEIMPALVASALYYIGQDKKDKAFAVNKYPLYVNAVMK